MSLGEGACSEGEFWESLNTACTLHLPVLYVVADNGYAISVPTADQAPAPVSDAGPGVRRPRGAPPRRHRLLRPCAAPRRSAIAHVRAGVGPALIHADVTRPYSHSSADTQSKYRTSDELAREAAHDPLARMAETLVAAGALTTDEVAAIRAEAKVVVGEATKAARAAARPDPATVTRDVVRLPTAGPSGDGPPTRVSPTFLGAAINRACTS